MYDKLSQDYQKYNKFDVLFKDKSLNVAQNFYVYDNVVLYGKGDHNFYFLCNNSWNELSKHNLHLHGSDDNFYILIFKVSWRIHNFSLNINKQDNNLYK